MTCVDSSAESYIRGKQRREKKSMRRGQEREWEREEQRKQERGNSLVARQDKQ